MVAIGVYLLFLGVLTLAVFTPPGGTNRRA